MLFSTIRFHPSPQYKVKQEVWPLVLPFAFHTHFQVAGLVVSQTRKAKKCDMCPMKWESWQRQQKRGTKYATH